MTQLQFQETDENSILILRINSLKVLVESSVSAAGWEILRVEMRKFVLEWNLAHCFAAGI